MKRSRLPSCIAALVLGLFGAAMPAAGTDSSASEFFDSEVWTKVGAMKCLKCHRAGRDAEDSDFLLLDPSGERERNPEAILAHNREAFTKMAGALEEGRPRILRKVVGDLDHGGEDVLEEGSTQFRILEAFVHQVTGRGAVAVEGPPRPERPDFFDDVEMLDPRRLLRRLTLSLAARLPSADEGATVADGGLEEVGPILDTLMEEEAFFDRLAEGFNDIFLTTGYDGVPENALSYEHFETTRHWYQKVDHSAEGDEDAQLQAGYKLAREYREAMLREPMEMVKHIVRNDLPFTELITADYIMVSPYTARGYGLFEEVRERFDDPDDHLEFIPVRLNALIGRNKSENQESATGYYPHAGLISTFQYLMRYPTTETNRNRLRVRMYFQQFLGIDIMQLAPQVNDAAAITAKYEIPTMEAADCVVCHKVIDPVAGLFQDYYALDANGVYGRRKDGWFEDMFAPGFEGEPLPEDERWRALQWLAERTADDPRFAVAMVEHVWYLLAGRRPLLPPEDIDHPLYDAQQRAYRQQREEIEGIARRFAAAGFNLKHAFKELALSPFYRADGLATADTDPAREAELADLGLVRLLTPEQLERKLAAVFGEGWGRLDEQFLILYGGIDTKEVTERIADPSGAMGAIQRMMSNEVACKNVALDFSADPGDRRLFPHIEPDVVPGTDEPDAEAAIRAALVHLHHHVLGRIDAGDSPEIDRSYALFTGIVSDARERGDYENLERYACQADGEGRFPDPDYTVRAWRAVVTYLLRQHEFLYE